MYLCCMCKLILNLNPEYLELQPLYFIYFYFFANEDEQPKQLLKFKLKKERHAGRECMSQILSVLGLHMAISSFSLTYL